MSGYWMLVLHSHLPFVKHPEYDYFLEEHWLYEAITETYIPLLMKMKQMEEQGIHFRITTSVTPPLADMLADGMLMQRYEKHLEKLIELAEKEKDRTVGDAKQNRLAWMYLDRFERIREFYYGFLQRNILNGYRYFQATGSLEIITCGFTHGFLPLLSNEDNAVRAQIEMAVRSHEKKFGRKPKGIWLPECAYYSGLEKILSDYGIRYFFVDTHGILFSKPRPRYGVYAPVFTKDGVAAFGRDFYSSKQVWSSKEGYPGDPYYRDFYRDIGYDLDFDYISPYISPDGTRVFTGLKYHRITGESENKEFYDPQIALEKTEAHGKHFVAERVAQLEELDELIDRKPLVVSPYDAELFGHWWFEGPEFLYQVFRAMNGESRVQPITPLEYLDEFPTNQVVEVNPSSWGDKGFYDVWLNGGNEWIYRHLHFMADSMVSMARKHSSVREGFIKRALNQMARELFLAQSSDWAFLMTTETALEYSVRRTKEHIHNFMRLREMLDDGKHDDDYLTKLENKNSIFPEIDFRVYA
ncbi:glycoside hydrolase family 57 protein [Limisalsivibrio acetivorans]|uniref:glycoside hydrolase family 57 protein n=1 Tax=Limisalsivibrio acetivorans TaxID=1304888 RepID=UPI0003B38C15|nr:1,4-alpha-glucan branching protein domain-containing protein [Limisalsivibrio acetivorans]